jgi:4-hydroxythreonine-4-phosphate dehydrogenase
MTRPTGPLPLALTMGEPAGIAGEITLKTWLRRNDIRSAFFTIDDPGHLARVAEALGLDVPIRTIDTPEQAPDVFPTALPVLPQTLPRAPQAGAPDAANANAVIAAIDRAVALTLAGEASAVVTNPIQKETLYAAGFKYPGHTEYLAELARISTPPVMMLACPGLRVVPITTHLPLTEALGLVSQERIVTHARITAAALARDFGIARPRLAVLAVNPHGGEGGTLGREEAEIIEPAIAELRALGLDVDGPHAADSLFHAAARRSFDVAICMYHDQGLIPLKTIDFEHGVNITLGLPFVRTSPDHGTALAIAGQGIASEVSLVAALQAAAEILDHRAGAAAAADN